MSETVLSIGGICFYLSHQEKLIKDREIVPFIIEPDRVDVSITFAKKTDVSDVNVCISDDPNRINVWYHPDFAKRFASLRGCLMHIPMGHILLAHNRFFLHASFIASPFGGLLFTGDSGVGKSTQAELWQEHMDSTIINGDRAILAKEENGWRAYGSPYAGSSGCYVKRDERVRAIVLLEQATENQMNTVSSAEAFRRLILQISVDHSRTEDVMRLCDLVTEMISSVPVYRLRCTPDVRAVHALCDVLRKEEADGGR